MQIKYLLGLISLCLLALVVSVFLKSDGQNGAISQASEERTFLPCQPNVKMDEQQLLLNEKNKEKQAIELIKTAEKFEKNMSQDPAELWQALEMTFLAHELVKNCKNPSGSLQIKIIDLKSKLMGVQEKWIQNLEMEVARYRQQRKKKEVRFCLRKLLRLIPDEEHPYHKKWLKELLP